MAVQSGFTKYKKTSIESANREKLLLLLYEGAIKFMKQAIIACEEKNVSDRCKYIGKAYDIILELNTTLDHKVGGPLAASLEQLYMFVTEQLTHANIRGDPEPLRAALKVTETLYTGWVQAIESIKKNRGE